MTPACSRVRKRDPDRIRTATETFENTRCSMRTMPKFRFLLLLGALACLLPDIGRAHDTNPPLTRLEAFEAQTGTVIIKGTGQIGVLSANTATVSVRCRESIDFRTGRREYGVL